LADNAAGSSPLEELLGIIAALRGHCPWMGALTHASLVEYLLEEAYEVAETIETGNPDAELQGELGDVLLQVVLHARLAEERGAFTFDDVARGLGAKMVRRNPHVFRPDGSLQEAFPPPSTRLSVNGTRSNGRSIRPAPIPSKGFPRRSRHWHGRKSLWTVPAGRARRCLLRLPSRKRRTVSGSSSSPSCVQPTPPDSTPSVPCAAPCAATSRERREPNSAPS
jgi:NTP pyrophosphatase (non-canonical NTP hydrolase)